MYNQEDSFRSQTRRKISKKTSFSVAATQLTYYLKCLIVSEIIKKEDYMEIGEVKETSFKVNETDHKNIWIEGSIAFIWNNSLYFAGFNPYDDVITISNKTDIEQLKEYIEKEIKENNIYKNKLIYYSDNPTRTDIRVPVNVNFDNIILDNNIKRDIYDNTIYYINNIEKSNGIILYGDPGTGKSLICSAIAGKAIEEKHSVIYLTNNVRFDLLQQFIEELIGNCIVIFEDIDSIATSRELEIGSGISDFLQFLNGISDSPANIIFIATTNYLDRLDKAVANRPVRFNRKYKIELPSNDQIVKLVELYFDKDIKDLFAEKCFNLSFTGAHIKEIKRTADLKISKNKKLTYKDVFLESLKTVKENFIITLNNFGFSQ